MNLQMLFQKQKELDDHIMDEHPELKSQNNLDWKILSLQVELGECANEWRGFKKWSKDQKARLIEVVKDPLGQCEGYTKYPLLEEYIDCLHFILSIGLELLKLGILQELPITQRTKIKEKSIIQQYKEAMRITLMVERTYIFDSSLTEHTYKNLLDVYFGLGEMLGFTWEQIEQAYMDKNAVNHKRQDGGY